MLENILIGMYGVNVNVKPIQPPGDATDNSRGKSDTFGGWEKVFEYCQHQNFDELLMFNDYVIIQIDTDMGDHPNYGVPLTHEGKDRPVEKLVEDVRRKIISLIDQSIYQQFHNQFKFAISVYSLECWLLPLYSKQKAHLEKTKNCCKQLERDAKLHQMDYHKEQRSYDKLSRPYRNSKELENGKQHQKSLALFLDSLPLL